MEIRKGSQRVITDLFNLNTAGFSLMLRGVPRNLQVRVKCDFFFNEFHETLCTILPNPMYQRRYLSLRSIFISFGDACPIVIISTFGS